MRFLPHASKVGGRWKFVFKLAAAALGIAFLLFAYWERFYASGYSASLPESPTQPVAFSHRLHAGTYQIDCLYCHNRAGKTLIAGLPSVKKCHQCHEAQGETGFQGEAARIAEYWTQNLPIKWIRVNDLPDHVYFSHRVHLSANVECSACHGDVAQMERIRRVQNLNMGWCVSCHQNQLSSIECSICHK